MIDSPDQFGPSTIIMSQHLVFKFQSYGFFFLKKHRQNCLSKSMDGGFESPSPGSLSPPPGYEASFTHNTIIHIYGFKVTKVE